MTALRVHVDREVVGELRAPRGSPYQGPALSHSHIKVRFKCWLECVIEQMVMYSKGEVILIMSVFLFVFCCFSIPVIHYATLDVTGNLNLDELAEIDIDDCPQQQVAS